MNPAGTGPLCLPSLKKSLWETLHIRFIFPRADKLHKMDLNPGFHLSHTTLERSFKNILAIAAMVEIFSPRDKIY